MMVVHVDIILSTISHIHNVCCKVAFTITKKTCQLKCQIHSLLAQINLHATYPPCVWHNQLVEQYLHTSEV